MSVSSAGQGLRPGVCTSSTRPTTPYDGMMIYETDTNRVLVWDNAAWVMIADTDSPPAMSLVSSGTLSGITQSTAQTLNVFSSEFYGYKIILEWDTTAATYLSVQLRDSSGPRTNSEYDYQYTESYGTTLGAGGGIAATAWIYLGYNYNQGYKTQTIIDLFAVSDSRPTYGVFSGVGKRTSGGSYLYTQTGVLNHAISSAMTGLDIKTHSNATVSGVYKVYGYRN